MVSISKDVVRHLHGRDASERRMYASHGVPMEASTDRRSEKFAIAIAQRQWAKRVRRSNHPSIVIDVNGLGDKTVILSAKQSGIALPSNMA